MMRIKYFSNLKFVLDDRLNKLKLSFLVGVTVDRLYIVIVGNHSLVIILRQTQIYSCASFI